MSVISATNCIRCYFDSSYQTAERNKKSNVEIFYAKTKDMLSVYPYLRSFISSDELMRAERFHFNEDRETYISCHATLRLVISKKLNTRPQEVLFNIDSHKKPGLIGNPLSFNITHTKDSFAFAVSDHSYIGIDLEKVRRDFDFISIIETFFSKNEIRYILESKHEAIIRFFLLWTRKEALVKALGPGIIADLTQMEVFQQNNLIDKNLFDNLCNYSISNENFIYSTEISDYYLSIAMPQKTDIILKHINEENLDSFLV